MKFKHVTEAGSRGLASLEPGLLALPLACFITSGRGARTVLLHPRVLFPGVLGTKKPKALPPTWSVTGLVWTPEQPSEADR